MEYLFLAFSAFCKCGQNGVNPALRVAETFNMLDGKSPHSPYIIRMSFTCTPTFRYSAIYVIPPFLFLFVKCLSRSVGGHQADKIKEDSTKTRDDCLAGCAFFQRKIIMSDFVCFCVFSTSLSCCVVFSSYLLYTYIIFIYPLSMESRPMNTGPRREKGRIFQCPACQLYLYVLYVYVCVYVHHCKITMRICIPAWFFESHYYGSPVK